MLSAIIMLEGDPASLEPNAALRAVTRTLATLVGAVVDEVVADAFVVARPGLDFRAVEDGTGCDVVLDTAIEEALRRALFRARRPDILLLKAGYAPGPDFAEAIARLLLDRSNKRALLLRAPPATLAERIARLFDPWRGTAGLVASRQRLEALPAQSLGALRTIARALSARPLRARAVRL